MSNLTLEKIAELSGVSRSTVSRVINDHASVRQDVRLRVQEVIRQTGYRPNSAARSLAGHRSYMMGLVIPETAQILFTDPYFPRLIQGISQGCNANNYTLSLFLFHTQEEEEMISAKIIGNSMFDGFLVTGTYVNDPLIPKLIDNDIPFVLIGRDGHPQINFVDADNFSGAYTIVSHLIRLGYQRIATIAGPMTNLAAADRRQGYIEAFQDRGKPIEQELVLGSDYTEEGGYMTMQRLLVHRPDAVFAASDTMAFGALRAIKDAGLTVPHDIALVGYDDLPPSAQAVPPLTTIRQPIKRLGSKAVDTLIDILENGSKPTRRIVMPTELVIRSSCGSHLNEWVKYRKEK